MNKPIAEARALRKQGQFSAAAAALSDAARRGALSPLDLADAGRLLEKLVEAEQIPTPKLRVHLLGQLTTSWLKPALVATSWGRNQPAVVTEGSYDQIFQDLLGMQPGEVDVIVLLPWHQRLLGQAEADIADELSFWRQCWQRVAALGAKLVQVGFDADSTGPLGLMLGGGAQGPLGRVRRANEALREALPAGAAFVDLDHVAGTVGRSAFYDRRRWYWTKQPFSEVGVASLANATFAAVRAVVTGPKKVLVLDLDNTLWGGVVGETGPLGVELGEGPDGEAFRAFQRWCKGLTRRGVLLAVCSKNEPEDARGPFESNPHMVLQLNDFAAFEAGWGPKSQAIVRMAEQLQLGLDSFVFFDDNPAEREEVRQGAPAVEVVEVPDDVSGYIPAIEAGLWFEATGLTAEDAQRAEQYQQERQRRELQANFADMGAYLRSLEMVADVRPIDEADLPRVVQLLGKTNQWNLTTRRHSTAVVEGIVGDPRAVHFTLRLRDRFGDHGLVAVLLAVPEDDALRIDTWLMSCRVIARTAEQFAFAQLVQAARAAGWTRLVGEYLPTKKNRQVADLYPTLGFAPAEDGRFILVLDGFEPPETFIQPSAWC